VFVAKTVLPIVNHRLQLKCVVSSESAFAAKLCCLQESMFAAEIVFSAAISSRW
jgi:hypothetical protein